MKAINAIAYVLIFSLLVFHPLCGEDARLPRRVIGLYNLESGPDVWYSYVHQYAAMPIEQNGLIIDYHHLDDPLPKVEDVDDLLGALLWLDNDLSETQTKTLADWIRSLLAAGKKFVLMGNPPSRFFNQQRDIWKAMGLAYRDRWVNSTYNTRFTKMDPRMVGFERQYVDFLHPYPVIVPIEEDAEVFLQANIGRNDKKQSILVATTSHGGYAASYYDVYYTFEGDKEFRRWYINPFYFFKKAYNAENMPIPDTTTLAGCRIYYSHIDGDGWNSRTQIDPFRKENWITAHVIRKEVIEAYPELPVTVAPIAADIDPRWVGLPESQEAARILFKLPQVEVASHTYSHPFDWGFFKNYVPAAEKPYLHLYPLGSWEDNSLLGEAENAIDRIDGREVSEREKEFHYPKLGEGYDIPRAFANHPFNLKEEVSGSIAYIDQFAPEGKKVELYQWSGNCQPFVEALEDVKRVGVRNLNGGDTRFDSYHASYAWVRPISRTTGPYRQIYASASNENTYTALWTKKFYGFNQLVDTWSNTGSPIRVKPINLYYHMYSGEKFASLNALLQNIEYLLSREFIPIDASHFAEIAAGFYSMKIDNIGDRSWRFLNRGKLQTIRFDQAAFSAVDFDNSLGIVGQRRQLGSLFVYLDAAVDRPVITLKDSDEYYCNPVAGRPYLVSSTREITHVEHDDKGVNCMAIGRYPLKMIWVVPENGVYTVSLNGKKESIAVDDNNLTAFDEMIGGGPLKIRIEKEISE
ncbi:MAG: hypothetical protein H7A37_08790 [Chlamydiales bacterium]|nr:hypothetical protein [Chlamydiia bacterium]MCP5508376.1 hypothetical protein [Chlamydiales bacterium]